MNALAILQGMRARYANLQSYKDKGTVTTTWMDGAVSQVVFQTSFQRPSFFHFEWTHFFRDRQGLDKTSHSAIWCDGARAYSCDDHVRPQPEESLEMAIAAAAGVSSGSAHTVSAMLMEEVGGFLLEELEHPTASENTLEGKECYRVRGVHPSGAEYEVFVGKHDLLLRQVTEIDLDGVTQKETRAEIRVNEPIDGRIFQSHAAP